MNAPCDAQIDFVIKNLLVEVERLPRWPSICTDTTVVPSLLVVFDLLRDEIIQLNYVCVLSLRVSGQYDKPLKIYLCSKLVGSTVYADDKVSAAHSVTTWHNCCICIAPVFIVGMLSAW